jgi:hypothetical protein
MVLILGLASAVLILFEMVCRCCIVTTLNNAFPCAVGLWDVRCISICVAAVISHGSNPEMLNFSDTDPSNQNHL